MSESGRADVLFANARLATLVPLDDGYGIVEDGAVAVRGGRIAWVGRRADAPKAAAVHDCDGLWLTPGLVDCHTHIVYAGNRSDEWEARLNGASYEDIARAGGGIMSTVRATRLASETELKELMSERLARVLAYGTTTIEIKSGYGLSVEAEMKSLWAIRDLNTDLQASGTGPRIAATFLGAHAVPEEYSNYSDDYVKLVVEKMLPEIAREGLAEWLAHHRASRHMQEPTASAQCPETPE